MTIHKCRQCDSTKFTERVKGPHLGRYCVQCETFWGWIPRPVTIERALEAIIYFGQYKGCKLRDLPTDYLEYLIDNVETKIATLAQVVLDYRRLPDNRIPN